jgi:uncharacterized membrane protein
MTGSSEEWDSYAAVGKLLRAGVTISFIVLLIGLLVAAVRGEPAGAPPSINELPSALYRIDAAVVLGIGVIVLILTPVVRVVATIFIFGRERNRTFVAVAAIVLFNLTLGFLLGVT